MEQAASLLVIWCDCCVVLEPDGESYAARWPCRAGALGVLIVELQTVSRDDEAGSFVHDAVAVINAAAARSPSQQDAGR